MSDADSRKAITGPVRKTHSAKSKKPYARPQKDGLQRSESILGGLKSAFKSFFAASPAPPQQQQEGGGDQDRTRSDVGSAGESSDDEEEEKAGSKRVLASPGEGRGSKRLRRASPSPPPRRLTNSQSLGYGHSLSAIASGSGMKRSGTLLSLDTRKSRPSISTHGPATRANQQRKPLPDQWSPWKEPQQATSERQPTATTRGFSRSGSIGYGLHPPASPLRPSHAPAPPRTGSLFASPAAAHARRPRSVLHPLASASLVRSPSLPGTMGMREPRRETTALPSSPVVAQRSSGLRHELERSPSAQRMGRDSSVLSGMSGLIVRENRWGAEQQREDSQVIEAKHKSEAERILATLSNMRSTNSGISQSYSSRTLRKQIAIPAPSMDPIGLRASVGSELRRAREAEGGVMVSPYGKRRARERSETREREESVHSQREESMVARSRGSPTPMRESPRASPSPAPQERPDPSTFPEPPTKSLPKPLPIAFSPSAKNLPSAATALRSKASASSLRARTTLTTRKHTSAARGRFSALDDDDEEEGDGFNVDLEELERAAEKRSAAPKIVGPMDLFAPKNTEKPAEPTRNEPPPVKQAPGFLNVKLDHKPRSSSPLKAMVVPSPESAKASSAGSQGEETPAPAFSFAKPADAAKPSFSFTAPAETAEKPSSGLGIGKPSSTPAASGFSFATPAKPTEPLQNSTTPAAPVPSSVSTFSFNPAEKTEPLKAPAFSFGGGSSTGPPAFFSQSASDKPAAEPKGVAPPKAGLFNFSSATPSAAPVIPPAVASSLPVGNPFATVSTPSTSTQAEKPAEANGKSVFSFGNTTAPAPAEVKANVPASTPSLFGAPTQTSTTPAAAPAPAFNFGSPAPAPPAAPSTTPSFSFGKSAESPKPAASSPFSFGAAPAASSPAKPPAFNFGSTAPAPSSPAAAPAPLPAFGGFGTNTASPSPAAASTTFNFGTSSSGFGAPAPASAGFGASAPASAGFGSVPTSLFGAAASTPTPTAPGFGGFGTAVQSPQPTAAATSFNFGAPSAAPSSTSFAFGSTPVATPAAATFGGFSAPSPGFGAREATATPPPMFNMGADNTPGSPGAAGRRIRGIPKRGKK